jgi:hypothetical protein
MRLLFALTASLAAIASANAQGTISVTRPASVGFRVTSGIGSSATLTTHPPAPPPDFTNKARITGLFPYVPEPVERKDEGTGDKTRETPKQPSPPSAYQAANSIGRDRIESPQDAAFSKDNYFRQRERTR